MPRVIVTAQVEDTVAWEKGFRTHGDLFREQTTTAVNFTVTTENEVAVQFEMDNLGKFLEVLESPATAEAMGSDGVKPETVKVFVLDNEFDL